MESRYDKFINDVASNVISNFSIEIPHENKKYNLKLSDDQAKTIRNEIDSTLKSILNSQDLSVTQKNILDKLLTESKDAKFRANLIGGISFADHFSLFSKYEKVNKSGLTGLYYDNLIFEISAFKNEQLFNSWPFSYLELAKPPGKDLQMRFNGSIADTRKEFIIAVLFKSIADFGAHDDHIALAKELKDPNNKIIAAMRKPYGHIAFFSSAKEINSKAYFAYQQHVFTGLLGGELFTKTFEDRVVFDVGRQISFLLELKDLNSLACVNRVTAAKSHELREEYAELYYRKRN
jgi:hypothetical protein